MVLSGREVPKSSKLQGMQNYALWSFKCKNILQEERLLKLVDPDLVSGASSSIAGALSSTRLAQLNIVVGLMTSSAKTLGVAPQKL
jgi:hypothetical protein